MITLLTRYIIWWLMSKNLHGAHSPFLYRFMKDCLYKKNEKNNFFQIEQIRTELLSNNTTLTYTDHGAGTSGQYTNAHNIAFTVNRTIAKIARKSLQRKKFCQLYSRIATYFQCKTILELGTSFGITTSYIAAGNRQALVQTIEGGTAIALQAKEVFEKQKLTNIELHNTTFYEYLQSLTKDTKFDLILLDGHHNGDATIKYFQILSNHTHNDSVFILDDIRWSDSMTRAWHYITRHPEVTLTIDMFKIGLVFFNKKLSKEYFMIRY